MKALAVSLLSAAPFLLAQQSMMPGSPINLGGAPLVTGKPYSAKAVTETLQTLPDGNHISQRSSAMIYRDGEGRQRREMTIKIANSSTRSVFILDPIARVTWSLNELSRAAVKSPMPALPPSGQQSTPPARGGSIGVLYSPSASDLKDRGFDHGVLVTGVIPGSPAESAGLQRGDIVLALNGRLLKDGTDLRERLTSATPGSAVAISLDRNGKTLQLELTTRDRPEVYKNLGPATLGVYSGSVLQSLIATGLTNAQIAKSKIEDLGMNTFDGVNAQGTRITLTVAPGELGNELPFDIVNEVWYSADLQAVLFSKHRDPRSGEVSYRLAEIMRIEPPASVFQVPSDYTVTQMPAPTLLPQIAP